MQVPLAANAASPACAGGMRLPMFSQVLPLLVRRVGNTPLIASPKVRPRFRLQNAKQS